MYSQVMEVVLRNRNHYVNLLACQEFYVHQSRAFWKTVWLMLD